MEPHFLGGLAAWQHRVLSTSSVKARILLIHGISEHSGRHINTVHFLCESGFEVITFDLRGSGRSGGRRQYINNFQEYIEDTIQVFKWISSDFPSLPLFVLGHSLGGAIATYFAATYGKVLHGLVLSAPAYRVGGAISPIMLAASHYLAILTPGLRVPKSAEPTAISRDPRSVKEYVQDPLCTHFNTVKQATEVLRAIADLPKVAAQIPCPVLIVHGSGDQIIRLDGSFEILQQLTCPDKEMQIYPGGYHELHNDLDKEGYLLNLGLWLKRQLK